MLKNSQKWSKNGKNSDDLQGNGRQVIKKVLKNSKKCQNNMYFARKLPYFLGFFYNFLPFSTLFWSAHCKYKAIAGKTGMCMILREKMGALNFATCRKSYARAA